MKPRIALITPALAAANNGNWHTARRWSAMLEEMFTCDIALTHDALPFPLQSYAVMIALHARRSAPSIAAFAEKCPNRPLIVALTGTDLYRDIAVDANAQQSLAKAHRLIVLQDQALQELPAPYRDKTDVLYQSCVLPSALAVKAKNSSFQVLVVGHLRSEKAPETVFAAAALLANTRAKICITHLGAGLDAELALQAQHTQTAYPEHYRWLGAAPHDVTLQTIADADALLHPSIMEGGANVIIEAVQHATPVLASRMSGNIGMLGANYAGYFPVGDAASCASLIARAASDVVFLAHIQTQCALRSPLFSPLLEAKTIVNIVRTALQSKA